MDKIAMQIRLAKIEELSYENRAGTEWNGQEPVFVKLLLNVSPVTSLKIVELVVGVIYHTHSRDILAYDVKSIFEIGEIDALVRVKEYSVSIAPELLSIMIGVTIGSLRGMLILKTQGTVFENYPLPIINITQLVASLQTEPITQRSYFPFFRFKYE